MTRVPGQDWGVSGDCWAMHWPKGALARGRLDSRARHVRTPLVRLRGAHPADISRHDLLDGFRLDVELPEPRQGPARHVVRLEKVNLAGGERRARQSSNNCARASATAKGNGTTNGGLPIRRCAKVTSSRRVYTPGPASS